MLHPAYTPAVALAPSTLAHPIQTVLPNALSLSWKLPSVLEEHGTVRQCQLTSAKSTSQIDVIQRLRAATAIQSKFGERAFSHAGPSAWNFLPDSIRNEPNSAIFRKHLKTHFFCSAVNVC